MTGLARNDTPADLRSCCASLYQSDWARLLLGDSFHPGGLALTERLGQLLRLGPDHVMLDVAAGRGTSAVHLARVFGCRVVGLDYGAENVVAAGAAPPAPASPTASRSARATRSGYPSRTAPHVATGAIAGTARGDLSRLSRRTLRDFALAWTATPLPTGLVAALVFRLAS
jgi:hypothetical protein